MTAEDSQLDRFFFIHPAFIFFTQQKKVSSDYQVNEYEPNEMHIDDEYSAGFLLE